MENNINFFIPLDADEYLEKASKKEVKDKYDEMYIQGIASDDSKDSDGEEIEPLGLVLDRFVADGLINYEHLAKQSPKFIIGEPIEAKTTNKGFFIKAKLWKGHDIAQNLWDTLLIMKANNSKRKLGWSIEGKALERDRINNKRITKAQVTHVAVTFMPKNYNTYADLVKGEQSEDFIKYEIEELKKSKYIYEFEKAGKCYGITKSFEIEEKKDEEVEEKAVDTSNTSSLRRESLDSKIKNIIKKSLLSGKISVEKAHKIIKKFY